MPVLWRITLKNLKDDWSKTLMTFIGVSLSIAVMSSIILVNSAYIHFMEERARILTGSWSISVENMSTNNLHSLVGKSKVGFGREEGVAYALLPKGKNLRKPYIYLSKYDQDLQDMANIELIRGQLPKEKETIAVPNHLAEKYPGEYGLGKEIELNLGSRELISGQGQAGQFTELNPQRENFKWKTKKKFKIVGLIRRPTIEPILAPGYTALVASDEKAYIRQSTTWFSEASYVKIFKDVKSLEQEGYRVVYNNELLKATGKKGDNLVRKHLTRTTAGLIVIVFIGLCMLLMNGFTISNRNKEEEYRLYAALGMRRGQMNTMLAIEGLLYGLVSLPVGIFMGSIGAKFVTETFGKQLMSLLGRVRGLGLYYNAEPKAFLIIIVLSVVMVELALILSMLRTAEVFEEVSEEVGGFFRDVGSRMGFGKMRTSLIKLFGVSGLLAYKGYRRNRRQYLITVIAISLAIIMFIASSGFVRFVSQGMENRIKEDAAYDISLRTDDMDVGAGAYGLITNSQGVRAASFFGQGSLKLINRDEPEAATRKVNLVILDERTYAQYMSDQGIELGRGVRKALPQAVAVGNESLLGRLAIEGGGQLRADILFDDLPAGLTGGGDKDTIITSTGMAWAIGGAIRSTAFTSEIKVRTSNQRIAYPTIRRLCLQNQIPISGLKNLKKERMDMRTFIFLIKLFFLALVFCVACIALAGVFNTSVGTVKGRRQERYILKTLGATNIDYRRMICYEALLYVGKAILISILLSPIINWGIYKALSKHLTIELSFPSARLILASIVATIAVLLMVLVLLKFVEEEEARTALTAENQ